MGNNVKRKSTIHRSKNLMLLKNMPECIWFYTLFNWWRKQAVVYIYNILNIPWCKQRRSWQPKHGFIRKVFKYIKLAWFHIQTPYARKNAILKYIILAFMPWYGIMACSTKNLSFHSLGKKRCFTLKQLIIINFFTSSFLLLVTLQRMEHVSDTFIILSSSS